MREQLREAARWRLIGLLFERPRRRWSEELAVLSEEVDDESLRVAARDASSYSEGAYLKVLGPGGAVSPREVGYRPMADPGRLLSELSGYYDAFGYHPDVEDPADHVAVQAGFAGFLALKEAYARARGDAEAAERTAEARRSFLVEHLGGFAGEISRRLETVGPPYLAAAARELVSACPVVRQADRLPVVPASAPCETGDANDDPLCGGCA